MMPIPVPPLPEHLNTLPLDPPEPFCRPFTLAEILSVTHNFDESLVIGQGGFGKVYKGVIDNEASVVAVKRLNSTSRQGDSEFRTEIEMLSKFRHSHIVSLIGYCYSSTEMILVYAYMVNGSLADHLYKTGKYRSGPTSSWVQRLKICLGAARGLDYLHTGTGVQDSVIHRDVKSSNILLDKNCAAKVSDFGLSRINPIDQSCTHISTNVKGTIGYMDPEYLLTLKLTMKSDVYSFGVVLFEVLCGRRAVDLRLDDEQWSLARWAQHCIEKGTLHQIIDPNLRWEIFPKSYTEFARIANQCLCYQSKKRPTMTQVVASLELALALQLGHRDSSAFEMELFCTSEAPENIEKIDSKMVQEVAIKFGSCDEDNKDTPQSHLKPTKRKALRKMLQLLMFRTVREVPVAQLQDPPPVDARAREGSGAKLRSGTSKKHIDRPEEFLFLDLAAATNNFSLENKIGDGSVGIVYKGKLLDGREVAIKRGEKASSIFREKESSSAFNSELASSSRLHHKNLVRLVGFCESGRDEERLLVYEYMKHGALYHRLHDKNNVEKISSVLNSWKMRIKISLDAARGIEYLHNYAVPPIIHRDIRSTNILLDANWTARVSDFGLSMILMGAETDHRDYSPTKAAGTVGYMDPEYYKLNVLTAKSDVYSFGVVLLELLTGKRAIFIRNGENGVPTSVVDFAVPAIIARELPKVLDPRVGSPLEKNETEAVKLVAYTAMQCVNLEGRERPTMFDIVANLERALALCDDI